MALVKTTALESGYTAEYWRIMSMNTDMATDSCSIKVSLYKDQAAREADKEILQSRYYQVARSAIFDKDAGTVDNPLHAGYTHLKTLDDFSDATDA